MPTFEPVDYDPFAGGGAATMPGGMMPPPGGNTPGGPLRITVTPPNTSGRQPTFEPVDYDPFAGSGPVTDAQSFAGASGDVPGMASDLVKSLAIGAVKGGIGLAGLPGDLAEYGAQGLDYATRGVASGINALGKYAGFDPGLDVTPREARAPTYGSADIRNALEQNVTGPLYEPKTTAGHYAQSVGEFLPGAALGGGGMVRNAVNFAVAPGLASEYAGQKTKGTALEPYARAGASVLTGGVASLLNRPSAPSQVIRGAIPNGTSPAVFDQAQALVDEAGRRGIRLTMPEAIEQVSPGAGTGMLNQMRLMESMPDTRAPMARVFADRPAQMDSAARSTFDTIAPRPTNPSMIGPAAGEASVGVLDRVRGAINTATRPSYDAARQSLVPQTVHAAMIADPLFEQALAAVRNDPARNSFVRGLSDRSTVVYDAVKKELEERARNAASPANPHASQQVASATGSLGGDVRRIAVAADRNAAGLQPGQPGMGNLEQALADQARLRQQHLEPLQRGPLGRMADKDTTTRKAVDAVFGTESKVAGSEREIFTAMTELSARSPAAARQLVRAHAEMTFDNAARDLQAGANQFGAANFAKDIAGNPQDRANLAAAVTALPGGTQTWAGFEKFLEIAQASGKRQRPNSLTAYNAQDIKDLSSGRLPAEVAKVAVAPGKALSVLSDAWGRWQLGSNTKQLAAILTDPRAGPYLKAIASQPVGSNLALQTAVRLFVMANQTFKSSPNK